MQNSMSHRGETRDVKANKMVQRNIHRSKDETSSIVGFIRKQRLKYFKCESIEHSVRKWFVNFPHMRREKLKDC